MSVLNSCSGCFYFQNWLEAIEDHSAYSTHYCTQEQLSDEEDEDTVSVAELQETLKVCMGMHGFYIWRIINWCLLVFNYRILEMY